MMMKKLLLVSLFLSCFSGGAQAQPETRNWRFGTQAGLVFPASGAPAAAPAAALISYEANTAVSDGAGNLLCYASGTQVWDATNAPMPNGALAFGHNSATQGALLVPKPASQQQYYLFTVDAIENALAGGLHYSVVDMSLRGGRGDIGPVKDVPVPLPNGQTQLAEKLTAVPLPNGRDYWIVVHGWNNNLFYSFLLTPTGLQAVPVVSSLGVVHTGGNGAYTNAGGYLRASPDGTRLAMARRDSGLELFDFNRATGTVSNAYQVNLNAQYYYGLDFSADGSKLYVSDLVGSSVRQIDLSRNYAITVVGNANSYTGAILRGNDGRIYIAQEQANYLAVIPNPNAAGLACGFLPNGVLLPGAARSRVGLPNFPVKPVQALSVAGVAGCAGTALTFAAALTPPVPNTLYTWNFGDPSAGAANTATGATVRHTYAGAGSYPVSVVATGPGGSVTAQATALVAPLPVLSLAPRLRTLCAGALLTASVGALPVGTTLRWQDGPVTAARPVTAAGRYVLTATSAQGCSVRDSVDVQLVPLPQVSLGNDTVLCASQAAIFLHPGPQPAGSSYRWQDGSTGPTYAAKAPGTYRLVVRNAAGCEARDSLTVSNQPCPVLLPNIITPNGDPQNQFFVLQGLRVSDWSLAVFNRWGREVFRQAQYDNRWEAADQPNGVYFYRLTNTQSAQTYKGWVEVRR